MATWHEIESDAPDFAAQAPVAPGGSWPSADPRVGSVDEAGSDRRPSATPRANAPMTSVLRHTKKEAMRLLKRHLSNVVDRRMLADLTQNQARDAA